MKGILGSNVIISLRGVHRTECFTELQEDDNFCWGAQHLKPSILAVCKMKEIKMSTQHCCRLCDLWDGFA